MRNNMDDADLQGFNNFLERNWGIKPPKEVDYEEQASVNAIPQETQPKKRGRKPKKAEV